MSEPEFENIFDVGRPSLGLTLCFTGQSDLREDWSLKSENEHFARENDCAVMLFCVL